ncbi:glycoside hydrolase family 18 protein [Cylindrobasidium torrendii FP15055 ss-10]|uniref:Glycoside hydrolase family 18 protein n=1 Tax=Cylindrobasidium torrendii FP15055 ss-10 TaxID=1314674 RepID=A0A0D7AW36_9AGAR|nr:glycoside hydrolase family 18 protein [Cylindrobasidium torrendii FP15055 ss-10]
MFALPSESDTVAPTVASRQEVNGTGIEAPHWVIYGDKGSATAGPPPVAEIEGFNVFALSFLLLGGPWDKAQEWFALTADEKTTRKAEYAAAGIKLIVSAFGATDVPTTSGADAVATAKTMAAWVKDNQLDGIDVDYEDFAAMEAGTAEPWLISFTETLRAELPQGEYIVSHAPVAPWFTTSDKYPGGGYLKIHESVGASIDMYNLQFYNQGTAEYTDCAGLLDKSSDTWPGTALFEIIASGVDASKLVIGKPGTAGDATNGQMSADDLATCLETAKGKDWNGGAMVWQYPNADTEWIKTVRSKSWPVGA